MKNEDNEKSHIEAANVPALTANRRNWIIGGLGIAAGLAGALVAWQKFEPHAVMDEAVQNFWMQSFERPEGGNLSMQAFQGKPLLINDFDDVRGALKLDAQGRSPRGDAEAVKRLIEA